MPSLLVIDDSLFQHNLVKKFLIPKGFTIISATSASDAFNILDEQTPDCIILDLVMPEMSGLEFLEIIHEQGMDIPVIVLTADIQKSVRDRCVELGAIEVLPKPLQTDLLLAAIDSVLSGSRE